MPGPSKQGEAIIFHTYNLPVLAVDFNKTLSYSALALF